MSFTALALDGADGLREEAACSPLDTRPALCAIRAYFASRTPILYYVANDVTHPAGCVGLIVNGQKKTIASTMLDGGSNCFILSSEAVEQLGVPTFHLPIPLSTSAGSSTIKAITAPLMVSYGDEEADIQESHCFLVVDTKPGMCFHALLGNPDLQKYGAIHDTSTCCTLGIPRISPTPPSFTFRWRHEPLRGSDFLWAHPS